MFRFVLKRRGAISVFLVVVLVPMLVMSATMVDVSAVLIYESYGMYQAGI